MVQMINPYLSHTPGLNIPLVNNRLLPHKILSPLSPTHFYSKEKQDKEEISKTQTSLTIFKPCWPSISSWGKNNFGVGWNKFCVKKYELWEGEKEYAILAEMCLKIYTIKKTLCPVVRKFLESSKFPKKLYSMFVNKALCNSTYTCFWRC